MHVSHEILSEICKNVRVISFETGDILKYDPFNFNIEKPGLMGEYKIDSVVHTYILYWPGGLVTYVVSKLDLQHLQPNFIEAAHASAKHLKPFCPLNRKR